MFKKGNALKTAQIALSVILLSVFILGFAVRDIFAQNQDCPSCPKKDEKKQEANQPQPNEKMVGDIKVIEIPSKYTREELEKMFPVPERWKEWYRLEKEGKLPKYVKLYDAEEKYIIYNCTPETKCTYKMDYLADILIFSKKHNLQFDEKNIRELRKIISDGDNFAWGHFYMKLYEERYISISLIPLLFEGLKAKNGLDCYSFQDRIYYLIQNYLLHPIYFKDEINSLKKYIPDFWKIYDDAEKIKTNSVDIILLKFTALNSLYLLNEDISKLISTAKKIDFQGGTFTYSHLYFDPVNNYEIVFCDYRLKPLYDWIYKEIPLNKWAAYRYYSSIGEGERYIDEMIEYCKNNFNDDGLLVFELLGEFKNEKRVRDLIIYFNNNKSKFSKKDYDSYQGILWDKYRF